MSKFIGNKGICIFLYGYNQFSIEHANALLKKGYKNIGIIDKKATSINIDSPCDIIDLQSVDFKSTKDSVFIICLQDGMKHTELALQLNKLGAEKILFIPLKYYGSYEENSLLRKGYLRFALGDYENIINIPSFNEISVLHNNNVIDKGADWISFWCDVKQLYSMNYEQLIKHISISLKDKISSITKYADIPITEYMPYVELFDYLSEKQIIPVDYLNLFCGDDIKEQQQYLKRREILYDTYEYYFHYEPLMFAESPAKVEWNSKGYFHVIDGLHRCHYLIKKGYTKVPVIASIEQWNSFIKGD